MVSESCDPGQPGCDLVAQVMNHPILPQVLASVYAIQQQCATSEEHKVSLTVSQQQVGWLSAPC